MNHQPKVTLHEQRNRRHPSQSIGIRRRAKRHIFLNPGGTVGHGRLEIGVCEGIQAIGLCLYAERMVCVILSVEVDEFWQRVKAAVQSLERRKVDGWLHEGADS